MRQVVEHQTADGDGLEILDAGSRGDPRQAVVRCLKGQGNEAQKPTRQVLEVSQGKQVFQPFLDGFEVAIQHGCVGLDAQLVGFPDNSKPVGPGRLVGA